MCQPKVPGFSQLIKLSILTQFSVFSSFQNITINTCFIKIRLTRFKPGSFGVGSDHCATPTTTCRFICSIWCLASCLKGLIAANAFTNQTSVFLKKFKLHSRHVTLVKRVKVGCPMSSGCISNLQYIKNVYLQSGFLNYIQHDNIPG